jgi:hypothetical protein
MGMAMNTLRVVLMGWAVLGCALTAAGDTIYVDGSCGNDNFSGRTPDCFTMEGPKATIQAAIDEAVDGDEVVLADWTYTGYGNRDLDLNGKAITLRSASGDPALCIIDCEGSAGGPHRGFYFHNGEGPDSVVDGITIANGFVTVNSPGLWYGGGVLCDNNSSPTLANCIITGNATYDGGSGGGVYCHLGNATLTNCTISGNTSEAGGGVACGSSAPMLSHCTISGNYAGYAGGGVYCAHSSPTLTNCVISGNYAGEGGGVACNYSSDPALSNCTISGNAVDHSGAGLYCSQSDPALTNCIVWSNASESIYVLSSSSPTATYSNIKQGTGEPWFGVGCIDVDPLLTPSGHLTANSPCIDAGDPNGSYGGQTDVDGEPRVIGDFVDMGADEWLDTDGDDLPDWWEQMYFGDPVSADPGADPDGDGRTNLAEFEADTDPIAAPSTYYVALVGNNAWDGLCAEWDGGTCGPKATIQAGIDAAVDGSDVVIADGTYSGDGNRDLSFNGKAITVRSASGDPTLCIIDCEGSSGDPHRGFYFHNSEGPDSVVDGLTVSNGHTSESGPGGYNGAGILIAAASPMLRNCTFNDCGCGEGAGGGVCSVYGDVTLENCMFTGNQGGYDGAAGLAVFGGSVTATMCTFTGNRGIRGGGVSFEDAHGVLTGCVLAENDADLDMSASGGGIVVDASSTLVATDCTICRNSARQSGRGGGVYSDGTLTATNCRISGNRANDGAGLWLGGGALLTQCTIAGNASVPVGGAALTCGGGATLVNCIVWGNVGFPISGGADLQMLFSNAEYGTGQPWFGEGCIVAYPFFVDPDGPDNDPATWEDNDYRLSAGSPCIDAGDNDALPADVFDLDNDGDVTEPLPIDLGGLVRRYDDANTPDTGNPGTIGPPVVDMGAYEYALVGDLNGDGIVSAADIDPFVVALTAGPDAFAAQYPNGYYQNADCNGDGAVSAADIDPFVALLTR